MGFKKVLLLLAAWTAPFVAAELGVRLFGPEYGTLYHSKYVTGRHPLGLNRMGFRDRERDFHRRADVFRVAATGDSVTWGYMIPKEATWTLRLEDMWNSKERAPIEVWNISGAGRAPGMYLARKDLIQKIRPNLLLVQITMNDAGNTYDWHRRKRPGASLEESMPKPNAPAWRRFLLDSKDRFSALRLEARRSYLISWLDAHLTIFSYRTGLLRMDPASPRHMEEMLIYGAAGPAETAWGELLADLRGLKTLAARLNARMGLVVFPYRYLLRGDSRDNSWGVDLKGFRIDPFDRLEQFARQENLLWVNLLTTFQHVRDEMRAGRVPYDPLFPPLEFSHPNEKGHQIAAEAIHETLMQADLGNRSFSPDTRNGAKLRSAMPQNRLADMRQQQHPPRSARHGAP